MPMRDSAIGASLALEASASLSNYIDRSGRKRLCSFDSLDVTESLGFQTHRNDSRHPWTKEEDALLYNIMTKMYGPFLESGEAFAVKWDLVASQLSSNSIRKGKDCRKRWSNSLDPNLRRGKWTKDEDDKLLAAYKKHGPSWYKVSSELKGRNDDQCAKRYSEVLDPNTKDRLKPWTSEEDMRLIRMINEVGTKWKTISKEFEGRPALTVRNRWRKLLTEVVRGKADADIMSEVDRLTNGNTKLLEQFGVSTFSKENHTSVKSEKDDANTIKDITDEAEHRSKKHVSERSSSMSFQPVVSPGVCSMGSTYSTWSYSLEGEETNLAKLPSFNGGIIKDAKSVKDLVDYAKKNNVSIVINQLNCNQASHLRSGPFIHLDQGHQSIGALASSPDPLAKRSHHFTQFSNLAPFPKLPSSTSPPITPSTEIFQSHPKARTDEYSYKESMHQHNSNYSGSGITLTTLNGSGMPVLRESITDTAQRDTVWPALNAGLEGSQIGSHNNLESVSTGVDILDALDDDMDAELVDSFGMFYNILSKAPKPEHEPSRTRHNSSDSIYDAWGGGHDFVPFNPS